MVRSWDVSIVERRYHRSSQISRSPRNRGVPIPSAAPCPVIDHHDIDAAQFRRFAKQMAQTSARSGPAPGRGTATAQSSHWLLLGRRCQVNEELPARSRNTGRGLIARIFNPDVLVRRYRFVFTPQQKAATSSASRIGNGFSCLCVFR